MLKVALNITDCQGILDPLYQTGFVEKCTAKKRQSGNDLGGRACELFEGSADATASSFVGHMEGLETKHQHGPSTA